MYQAELHLQQEKDCVLSQLADEFGGPFTVEIEELHDHQVTFVLDVGQWGEECYDYLSTAPSVSHVERLDDTNLLVTKDSCGAYSAVYKNHGVLRRRNVISETQRVYTVLFFKREDLKNIISDFGKIGTVTLGNLTEFNETRSTLTDRQREVIEFALTEGYFKWPRKVTSEELADELDISRATFLEHLRKAERKLLTELLGEGQKPRRA